MCYCDPCEEFNDNHTCVLKPESKCFAAVQLVYENDQRIEVWSYGCLPPQEQTILQVSQITRALADKTHCAVYMCTVYHLALSNLI